MFIAPRDVSDKIDGGEGSHGTSDTEYSSAERSPPANLNITLPLIDINTRDSDRYRHPRRGHAASTDTRPEVIAIRAIRRRCTCITARSDFVN